MACVFAHSTDYDESDKLYLEELTLERGLDIYELISPERHAMPFSTLLCCGNRCPPCVVLLACRRRRAWASSCRTVLCGPDEGGDAESILIGSIHSQ